MDDLLSSVRDSPTAPGYGEILFPGEPERLKKKERLKEGIFVDEKTWGDITALADELGVEIPI